MCSVVVICQHFSINKQLFACVEFTKVPDTCVLVQGRLDVFATNLGGCTPCEVGEKAKENLFVETEELNVNSAPLFPPRSGSNSRRGRSLKSGTRS